MSLTGDNIDAQIDQWIRNYAVTAFHDMRLNAILHMMVDWIDSGGTTGSITGYPNLTAVTSADFTNATDCPMPTLGGATIQVYWNEGNRFLEKDASEWTDLVMGGFSVTLAGFDSTAANYHFKVFTTT